MAKLVIDAAKYNSKTGCYDVEKYVCIKRLRDRSRPDQQKELVSLIDASDRKQITIFHKNTIEPLVQEFLKTRFEFNPNMSETYGIGDDLTPERMESFRNAFYHYQFACSMATRYQRNEKGACRDIKLTKDDGEKEMLDNIPGLYLKGEERFHLGEIVQWVEGRYGKLIKKVLDSRPRNDNGELWAKKECIVNYFAKRGLKYLHSSLRDGLDLKQLKEAKKHCDLPYASAEIPFILGLKEGVKPKV